MMQTFLCFYTCTALLQGSAVDDPEKALSRKPDDNEPLAGLAFKIMADQFQVSIAVASFAIVVKQNSSSAVRHG